MFLVLEEHRGIIVFFQKMFHGQEIKENEIMRWKLIYYMIQTSKFLFIKYFLIIRPTFEVIF